jgi:aquaporin Z
MKKYFAEMVGTMVLVLLGCGAAVALNCGVDTASVIGTAFAFGLAVVAMAYTIGGISGCHINPAITLGVWMSGRMSGKDACWYMVFQVIGACLGAAILYLITRVTTTPFGGTLTGANTCAGVGNVGGGLLVECILTFIFVLVVFGATSKNSGAINGGLYIGLALTMVHLVGIPLTGTSVNPARSIGIAIFANGGLDQLWLFIIAPIVGGLLAWAVWNFVLRDPAEEQ